jgi:hypothetical protein
MAACGQVAPAYTEREMDCICCGGALEGRRAKEHVVPQWLLDHLDLKLETFYQQVVSNQDGAILGERSHAAQSFIQGKVCLDCNNGWMSDLEDRAKRLLISLIDGQRTLFALGSEERTLLARWAAKTAYLVSHTALQQDKVGVDHLRSLAKDGILPSSVGVVAKQHPPSGMASFCQRNEWLHAHPDPDRGIPIETTEGYKIGLQFRYLLLLVAYWPGHTQYLLAAGLHVPLWPTDGFYASYYAGVDLTPDMDSRVALGYFSTSLAAIHRPPRTLVAIPRLQPGRRRS